MIFQIENQDEMLVMGSHETNSDLHEFIFIINSCSLLENVYDNVNNQDSDGKDAVCKN